MLYWALVFLIVAIIAAIFGFGGVAVAAAGIAKLLFFIFLVVFIITLITGQLDIVLEVGQVTLRPGESIVLPASMHDLRNTSDVPATFVYTSFPLIRQG